jgi:ABC-type branched-subunit amino acid transport system substrate-binding protein
MRRRSALWAAGSACAALVALLGSGCGSSSSSNNSTPGVSASSVTFGTHQPITGPAAPGYSEIAPASAAFFEYLNAQGGIFGRKIHLIIKDDTYNPSQTVNVVHQLVLSEHVFGIFEGLGTPTHTKVVGYLNSSKVPDLFVASGCPCWDNGTSQPYTYGWQPNYTIEGKILGQYIKQHFAGAKVGVFYQNDDFGKGGLAGIKDEVSPSQIVSTQSYEPGITNVAPQISAIKASGATLLVDFTVPIYTALGQLTSFTLGYKPQLVVSNVGIDPTTVGGLLKTVSKGKAGTELIEGATTDGYLPSVAETSNPWIALFKKVHDTYDSSAPFDGNVEYGMAAAYTLAQTLELAGKNLTREGVVKALNEKGSQLTGPGLLPYRYSSSDHGGYAGTQMGQVKGGVITLFGPRLMTTPEASSPITNYTAAQPAPPTTGVSVP